MRDSTVAYTAIAALVASMAGACDSVPAPDAPRAPTAVSSRVVQPTSFTFTKVPAGYATHAIASPVAAVETIVFQLTATQAAGITVKQFGFMISGSLQAGDVRNYQLVYYPDGLAKPGVALGTNDGAAWVAPGGSPSSFIYIDLATPITIPKGKTFTAYFALRADVTGTGAFFFYPRVQTCTVDAGTGDKDVAWFGGDLPLQGDQFNVN